MIKVFLVEDESIIRNGIKNKIKWEQEGFEFCGEAADGELAYPLIENTRPDILITDIKMPFMDGLELSSLVRKRFPDTKILILSGYNDFDYAKTAISLGITEYLLKPINAAKLLEVLKQVAETIKKEREQKKLLEMYQLEMEENVQTEKHKLWNALASNQLSTRELLEQGYKLGIDFTASCYQVILFKIMLEGDSTIGSEKLINASELVLKWTSEWEQVIVFDRSPEGWAFLFKGKTEDDIEQLSDCFCTQLKEKLTDYGKVEFFGGIGNVVRRMGDIRASYLKAAKAFSCRFFMTTNRFIRSNEVMRFDSDDYNKINISKRGSLRTDNQMVEKFLKSGTIEETDSFLEKFLITIEKENYQSFLYRQYVIMDIFFTVVDFLKELGINIETLQEEYRDINRIVEQTQTEEAIKHTIGILFKEVLGLRDKNAQKKYNVLLEEAKVYIRENYQCEDMSLNNVAAKVNISPSYFSSIFSSETGQTFVEYLTQVRMEKAKELLMCSNMRTAEIGYEVGYKDSHYFSYIFKKVMGISPKEYRSRAKEQKQ